VIRFEHLKKLSQAIQVEDEEITKNIKRIKTGDRGILVPLKLPIKTSPQLAALVGHVIGDGTINRYGSFEHANSAIEVTNKVKNYVKLVFNCNLFRLRAEEKTNTIVNTIMFPSVVGRLLMLAGRLLFLQKGIV